MVVSELCSNHQPVSESMDMSLSKLEEIVKDKRNLACSPWDCKESDPTYQLGNNKPVLGHKPFFLFGKAREFQKTSISVY